MQVTQARDDRRRTAATPYSLEEGVCYLLKGKTVDSAYRLARHIAESGVPVLCVSRIHPNRLRAKYGLERATTWWISESPGEANYDPTAVGTLSSAIEAFIEEHPGCFVLLDGVEFIAVYIGFTKALMFVEHLNEHVMPREAILMVPVDPDCFEPTEFARLDRFTESVSENELRDALDAYEEGGDLIPN